MLGLFALAAAVLIAIPGPNHLYIASRSVVAGRRWGIAAAIGVELGTAVHVALAAVGLSAVLAASTTAFTAVRIAGALYLLYLAWRSLRTPTVEMPGRTAGGSPWQELRRGALVNLLNPKVILFFAAFVPQFLDPGRGPIWSQVVAFGLVLVSLGVVSNLIYVVAAAEVAQRVRRRRSERSSGRIAQVVQAGIYTVLGVLALVSPGRT